MFLFANKVSGDHCSGWNCLNEVCKAANIKINATMNRHVVSTIYSSLDMKSADRKTLMDHMGHAERINEDNYQCPPGLKEVRVMGIVGWLCRGLTSQSTIFQSCRDGAIASWVINQYFRGVKCLAQGHNTAAVGLEPRTSRSGVRHSTTEPPRSPRVMGRLLDSIDRGTSKWPIL